MAVREVGRERAWRQKWLTVLVVVGLAVTALIVGITYWGSAAHVTSPVHTSPSPPADVNQQLSGYTFTRSDQGRPVFTVHAARTVSYQQSKLTTLEDVTVELFGPKGDRGDILRTQRCEYNSASGNFLTSGPVQMELNAHSSDLPGSGLRGKHRVYLETSKVAYSQSDDLAETEEPVKFHMGPASGTARGLVYAISGGWLELKHDVVVELVQGNEKAPQPSIHLTASALRYDKEGGGLSLTGPVEVTQSKRHAHSDAAKVELDDLNRVSQVNLTGHANASDLNPLRDVDVSADGIQGDFDVVSGHLRHIAAQGDVLGESRGKGGISHLTSERCDIDLGGVHPQPLQGVATGNVHINLESQPVLNSARSSRRGPTVPRRSH